MRKIYLYLTITWLFVIAFLCLVSFDDKSFNAPQNADKFVHFTFYFVLTFLMFRSKLKVSKKDYLLIFSLAVVYGIIIEVLQNVLTETRKSDIYDVFANILGIVAAIFVYKYIYKRISFGKLKN